MENNFSDGECRTYENLDALRLQVDNTDSASLHFESILENDAEPEPVQSKWFSFAAQLDASPLQSASSAQMQQPCANYANDSVTREKADLSHRFGRVGAAPKNELIDNALFNKFREAADTATIASHGRASGIAAAPPLPTDHLSEGSLGDATAVGRDDLLEFADKQAPTKDRGIDSDEVRIMTKVFGAAVSYPFRFCFVSINRHFECEGT